MFCSVCGAQLAPEMKHCPSCGARSAAYPAGVCPMTSTGGFGADIVDKTLIGMAVFMIFATFMSWYRVSVNMGDEPIDALANFAARILPAYSGVNTCYGLISLGVAFMAVILVVCKRYAWAAAVGIAGVALAVAAMFFTPDFVELNTYVGGGGDDSVADLLRSDEYRGCCPTTCATALKWLPMSSMWFTDTWPSRAASDLKCMPSRRRHSLRSGSWLGKDPAQDNKALRGNVDNY